MRNVLLSLGSAALLALACSTPAFAQSPVADSGPQASPASSPPVNPSTGLPMPGGDIRFDFLFDSIPLEEVIQTVKTEFKKKSGHPLNVIVPEHLLPLTRESTVTMDLRQVTVSDLFQVLELASQQEFRRLAGTAPALGGGNISRYETIKTGYRFESLPLAGGNPTFLLTATLPREGDETFRVSGAQPPVPATPSRRVRFFPLKMFLERYSIEDLTTAMRMGWDLVEQESPPTVKFHEETQLFVVSGTHEHIEVVEQVLRSLALTPGVPAARGASGLPVSPFSPALPSPTPNP